MEQLQRRHDIRASGLPGPGDGGTPTADLRPLREQAQSLVAASRDAVNRSLSRDSEAFLRAMRQEGGQ